MNGNDSFIKQIQISKICYQINMQSKQVKPLFTIFHFNDVYDIQPNKKGNGGIVNFEAYLRNLKKTHPNNIVLFSGDCFSPSILTNIFEGKQMVHALNTLGIHIACYGNHEFDFEPDVTQSLATSCSFKWLLGNIKYKGTEFSLGNGDNYVIDQIFGLKIGIFGVGGEDWLGILGESYQDQLQYRDVSQHSRKMCKILREENKCDLIIALTHMRVPQDQKLPLDCSDIDIVLGGHDHIIMKQFINGIPVLKSGDNFKTIGIIDIFKKDQNAETHFKCKNFDFNINVQVVPIATQGINLNLKMYVDQCMAQYDKTDSVVGYTAVDLDTRFSQVRTKQTNYGNFLTDLARTYYDCDCCVINSGAIRNDTIIKAGQLKYSTVSNLINDVLVVKQVPGSVMLEMLEYAVANLPHTFAGSFLVVSGIKYTYDYRKNPRVQTVTVNEAPLDLNKIYTVATFFYLSMGGDGFSMIRNCPFKVDQVGGIDLLRLILRFFKGLENSLEPHKKTLQIAEQIQKKISTEKQLSFDTPQGAILRKISSDSKIPEDMLRLTRKVSVRMNRISSMVHEMIEAPDHQKYVIINPKVEERIVSLYP